jgi:hypothetical protein
MTFSIKEIKNTIKIDTREHKYQRNQIVSKVLTTKIQFIDSIKYIYKLSLFRLCVCDRPFSQPPDMIETQDRYH